MTARPFLASAGPMLTGVVAWAVQFTVVYGYAALVCAGRVPFGPPTIPLVSAVVTMIAVGVSVLVAIAAWRHARTGASSDGHLFMGRMTVLIATVAVVAILWTGMPGVLTPTCAR
jgi:hypothetical protein